MNCWPLRIITLLLLIIFPCNNALSQPPQGGHLVIIDPAHGGADYGVKLSDKEYEKDVTLALSLLLKKELDKTGNIRAQLTRNSDKEVSLGERKRIVETARGEVLVSIHVNAGFNKNSSGYEIYFPGFKEAQTEQSNSKEIIKDMDRNKYLNNSVKLAKLIQKNMDVVFPRKGRGLRDAPIYFFEGLKIPAIVVEMGFATNPEDRKKLLDGSTQTSLAHALYQSIKEYF